MKAKDLFLALATSPIAPHEDFDRFVVGNLLDESFVKLKKLAATEMLEGKQPSRFQLIVGDNGNGKTLLANKLMRFLSELNEGGTLATPQSSSRTFDVLYSHVSALGKPSSQASLEIATNLRRSELEEPGITYSLIAAQIAKAFALQYQPPFWWRFLTLVARGAADIASFGIYGKLEEALRDKSAEQIRSALDRISEQFQKSLANRYYRSKFEDFLGELVGFEPFVKTYFYQPGRVGVNRLRTNFLDAINRAPTLDQPQQVVRQIGQLGRCVGCRLLVVIVDDCNQVGFIEQLLPLINDLPSFSNPKVLLIANMVRGVADSIEQTEGDRSSPQRIFYNPPIRLAGPERPEILALYGRLRALYNEAYAGERPSIPDSNDLRNQAAEAWVDAVASDDIEPNYRSAIHFLIEQLQRQGYQPRI